MSDSQIKLSREELHNRVWQSPMRTVAAELGVSDVWLAKLCRRMKVPVPGRGYWAKLAAGKKLKQTSLPKLQASDASVLREATFMQRLAREAEKPSNRPIELAEQLEYETNPENRIAVQESMRSQHPLIRQTREALDIGGRKADDFVWNWQQRHLDVDVTKAMLPRALRIMDALIKAFEHRGWQVTLASGEDRKTYVTIFGQKIPFGVREPRKQVKNDATKKNILGFHDRFTDVPAGKLALITRNSWGHSVARSWIESTSKPLEDRLNDFAFALAEIAYEESERAKRFREEQERRQIAEEKRLEAERKQRYQIAKGKLLEDQAENWRRSKLISEYLASVRALVEAEPERVDDIEKLLGWIEWGTAYAKRIDPLHGSLTRIYREPDQDSWRWQ